MRGIVSVIGRTLGVAAAAFVLSSCSTSGGSSPAGPPLVPAARPVNAGPNSVLGKKIKHIVIIFQENRSFDNLFQGFPGADTQSYGYNTSGTKVTLQPVGLETTWDIDHSLGSYLEACDGSGSIPGTNCKMDGFNQEWVGCGGYYGPCPNPNPQYSYVPHSESKPYFDMAKQYVLADRMFTSNLDGSSFISHQYIISGQADSAVNYPDNNWGCPGGPSDKVSTITQYRTYGPRITACFDYQTLGDELDNAGVSWHFYTATINGDEGIWSAYQAVSHIYNGPDWSKDIITPQTQFFTDVQNGALPAVSWITPTWENSDHAGSGSNTGPAWVTSLVNAVGQSQYWDSTAIFLMWDDYGGWYDHVAPPYADYDGLGIRVPLVIISPFAKKHYVSHVQYEHGSILRFVEDVFGLPRLAASDTRATSPEADAFNFKRAPRPFHTIAAKLKASFFINEPVDHHPPDNE